MEGFQRCLYWHSRGSVWKNIWKGGSSSSRRTNQTWWMEEVADAVGKKREIEDDRSDEGEWGTTEHNITVTVQTEEGGG